MRKTKWIKLFEAFKSERITKVLDFINKDSKEEFISEIKEIFNYLDIPMSEVSDDFFEYLPYKKAFDKVDLEDVGNLQYIKFWFDKDGKYITKSGTDGEIVDTRNIEINASDFRGSELLKRLDMINNLSNVILIKGYVDGIDGILYKMDSGFYFLSHDNRFDGGQPYGSEWEEYGDYSWVLHGGDFEKIIYIIKSTKLSKDASHNQNIESGSINLTGINNKDINKAHFAIVLDIREVEGYYPSLSYLKSKRDSDREGAISLISDEEFKKLNIKRYFDKIKTSIDISNIKDLNRVVKLAYYNKNMFYWSLLEGGSIINTIIEYYRIIVVDVGENKSDHLNDFNKFIEGKFINRISNNKLIYNLNKAKVVLKNDKSERSEMYYDIFIKIEEIANNFYKNFNNSNIETIYDLFNLETKLNNISSMFVRFGFRINIFELTLHKEDLTSDDIINSDIFQYGTTYSTNRIPNIEGCKKIIELLNDIEKVITKF